MHPVLVEVPMPWGATPLYSYGVMLGTALIVAWYIVMYLGTNKETLERDLMATTFIITAVSAIAFSRVLYVLTNLEQFHSIGDLFDLRSGGLVAYGGFFGGLFGAWLYLRKKGVSLLAWTDLCAPGLGMGLGLVRIGCYLYGCDFGARLTASAPTWLRDIGTFPRWPDNDGSPAWVHHVAENHIGPLTDYSLPVHPTQIYESIAGFVLAAIAFFVWRRRRFRGEVILTVAVAYGIWRFLIEYVRDDPERGFYFGFSTSQLISLLLVPVCAFLYHALLKAQGGEPLEIVTAAAAESAKASPAAPPGKARKKRKKRKKRG